MCVIYSTGNVTAKEWRMNAFDRDSKMGMYSRPSPSTHTHALAHCDSTVVYNIKTQWKLIALWIVDLIYKCYEEHETALCCVTSSHW